MAGKFFRLTALLLIFTSSLSFAAKNKKNKYSLKTSQGGVIATGNLNQNELEAPPPPADSSSKETNNEAGDSSNSENHVSNGPRYEISAIEDAAEGKNYYITRDENNNFSFVQKLSWNKIEDIKNYRITIQRKQDDGTWLDVLEKDLFENKIELSLEAGQYRFHVGVVNLFDQVEKDSDWKFFEVLKATQPKIEAMQTGSIYLNSKKANGIFTLRGENLTPSTKFTMEKKDADPPKIITGTILSISPDGQSAEVRFDINEISEGKYEIYAQNPGGLSVISKSITIKNKKDRNWRFVASANYACPFTFFDGTFNRYEPITFYPISAGGRMSIIAAHKKWGDIGFGIGGYYTYFNYEKERYSMSGNYANLLAYLVYQRELIPQRLFLEARLGAGVADLYGVHSQNKNIMTVSGTTVILPSNPELLSLGVAVGGGLAIQFYVGKRFFIEGNLDLINAKFSDMNLGMVYPTIGFGGKF